MQFIAKDTPFLMITFNNILAEPCDRNSQQYPAL